MVDRELLKHGEKGLTGPEMGRGNYFVIEISQVKKALNTNGFQAD